TNEHFRFMDLPMELRLVVYDFLAVETQHHYIEMSWYECNEARREVMIEETDLGSPKPSITIVHKSIAGLAIMRTCKLINAEAETSLRPRLTTLRTKPIRIICNSTAL
ncbi:hypothetical protein EK21DRAFT_28804, partial [Setomelanomma holmii]